jgi:hypothetical protein
MWPILDNKLREELSTYRRILQNNLRKLNLRDFGIMLAMYGSSRETAQPSFIVLCPEPLPQTSMTEGITHPFGLVPLRYTQKEVKMCSRKATLKTHIRAWPLALRNGRILHFHLDGG